MKGTFVKEHCKEAMAAFNTSDAICIIEEELFLGNLPKGWQIISGRVNNIDEEFTVLVDNKKFDGRDLYFEVSSLP